MKTAYAIVSLLTAGVLVAGGAAAQNFPNKPIRIVTYPAGGGADFVARVIADRLSESLGQPVIVENRSGLVTVEIVVKAPADGYTLLFNTSGLWTLPLLQKTSYDPVRDLAPVSWATRSPLVVIANKSVPARSARELIDYAKARPGKLNYGSGTTGGPSHLPVVLFNAMAGVDIVRIAYKGGGPAVIALLANEVQVIFATPSVATTHVKGGKLTAFAVTSVQPSALFPGLPALAETLPGYEAILMDGMFAPAGTPASVVNLLRREIAKGLSLPEGKDRLRTAGLEAVGSTPQQLDAKMKSEIAKWGKIIRDTGIRTE
mgnify:FL=1